MSDYIATVRGRIRHVWALKLGALIIGLGVRLVCCVRPEWSLDGGTWASLGKFELALDVKLARA